MTSDLIERLAAAEPGQWVIVKDRYISEPYRWKDGRDDGLRIAGYAAAQMVSLTPQKVRLDRELAYKKLHPRGAVVALADDQADAAFRLSLITAAREIAKKDGAPHEAALADIRDRLTVAIDAALSEASTPINAAPGGYGAPEGAECTKRTPHDR